MFILFISFCAAFAQAPSISYQGGASFNFTVNTPITPLLAENRGGTVPVGVQISGFSNGYNTVGAVAMDANYVYVTNFGDNKIQRVNKLSGAVSDVAGTGVQGAANGPASSATFSMPEGIALDAAGNIYVADSRNHIIRKITGNTVSTLAGSGVAGSANGTGMAASFNTPAGLAVDAAGNVYVADCLNNKIRKITPAGIVTTVAEGFSQPTGLAVDAAGVVYVANTGSGNILKISTAGDISLMATGINYPRDIKVDASGFCYVAEQNTRSIIKISPSGIVSQVTNNSLSSPVSLVLDGGSTIYVADVNAVRKISLGGYSINKELPAGLNFDPETGTISGTPLASSPSSNYTITATNASGSNATTISIRVSSVAAPTAQKPVISYTTPNRYDVGAAVSLAPTNTGGTVPAGNYGEVTTFAGSGTAATTDGSGTGASFSAPTSIARDADGNFYVVETAKRVIRKITPAGVVTTLAGIPGVAGNTDGPLLTATFTSPIGIVVDSYGNLFVSDAISHVIRKIDLTTNMVSTFCGVVGSAGLVNDYTSSQSQFKNPSGLAIDENDNIYVADMGNHVIRKIKPDGTASTFSGTGVNGLLDGTAGSARFSAPRNISRDAAGNFYVTGSGSFVIRKVTSSGDVSTISVANLASIGLPYKVLGQINGTLLISIYTNKNQIIEVSPTGVVKVLAGSGAAGFANGVGEAASFSAPGDIVYGIDGNLYIVDVSNNVIRKLILTGYAIDKTLPPGISFNKSTGVFSGSPLASWPATDYTVTAYNAAGASQPFVVNIAVNSPPDIVKPNITYSTPKVYTVGTVIAPLSPANTGGAVPAKIYADGIENTADLDFPRALAVDKFGFLYAVEWGLHQVDRINIATNVVERIAGKTATGTTDAIGELARFNNPSGIIVAADGTIYVADKANKTIRKLTWGMPATVTTIATGFSAPHGLAMDAAGNLYISDYGGGTLSKINMQTGTTVVLAAGFDKPSGIDVDADGNIFIAETGTNAIKKVTPLGVVSVYKNGFSSPHDVKVDGSGNLYVTDEQNTGSLKRVSANAAKDVTTISNNSAERPVSLTLDKLGNIYIGFDKQVRKLNISGYTIDKQLPVGLNFDPRTGIISGTPTSNSPATDYVITAYNGGGSSTFTVNIKVDGVTIPPTGTPPNISYVTPQVYTVGKKIDDLLPANTGGSVPATVYGASANIMSNLTSTRSIFVDAAGMVYVTGNNQVKKIDPATLQVKAIYGTSATGTDNGPGNTATFSNPYGVVVDADGNIYVADYGANLIRKISNTGTVSTFAGSGAAGSTNGTGTAASFNKPKGLAIDAAGNIYVADEGGNAVRKIDPAGVVTTLATGPLNAPGNITLDKTGNLYITDLGTSSLKKVTTDGTVSTVASSINGISTVQVDAAGNIYVGASSGGRRITPTGDVNSMSGIGTSGAALDGAGNMYNTSGNGILTKLNLTGYTIDLPLPDGLVFDGTTGKISGIPKVTTGNISFQYVVTAYNVSGSSKASLTIRINATELLTQTITFPAVPAKLVCDAPFTITATSDNNTIPVTYASSNPAIASIDASTGLITIKTVGTVVITAAQAGNSTYNAAEQKQSLVITEAARPDVKITAGKTAICVGESVTYTASLTSNTGMGTLIYQWQVNGVNVGANQTTYASSTLLATDKVTCNVTNTLTVNNAPCTNTGTNTISAIGATAIQTVKVTISSSATGPVCAGASITFTATPTPNDNNVTYQWKLNGIDVGINSASYIDNKFVDGDKVTCVFTNTTTPCVVGNPATSNQLTVSILPPQSPTPTVTIAASTTSTYAENPITFTASPTNANGTIIYQWQVNGKSAGNNSASFTTTTLKNADKVSLVMISGTCAVPAQSNEIYPTILPPLTITPPNTFTPNGDGVNDLWLISGLSTYPNCMVNVYSRNGESVFRSKGYSQPWDGFYKSSNLPVGTYYYVIDLANGKPKVSGYITIIR